MVLSRRRTLQVTGVSIVGGFFAGCLSESDPVGIGEGEPDEEGDGDDMSIDGQLHNESGEPQTFIITIQDADGETVATGEWEVGAGETKPIPAVGKPGEPRTFEVAVNEVSKTETLEFDVEVEPGERAGYVEITYAQDGTLDIAFTPAGDDGAELARVEEPLYAISEPECSGTGERDPLWLCKNMDAEPSVAFDQVETTSVVFTDEGVAFDDEDRGNLQYYAALLTAEDDLDRVERGGDVGELITGTEFESEAVLVAQTGWGSGSATPHFERIERTNDGVRAFGCYRRPCGGTTEVTIRTVVARIERPETLNEAIVSLTFDPKYLVNFATGEGVVTVDGL